jgi:Holliday junction resolvasome RuvABC endonuclease subunit
MHRTLGFDQSYTNSGFCITDVTGDVLEFGTFKSTKALDVYDRAKQVAQFIIDMVNKHNVNHVNLEGLAFGICGDATRDLAGLLFVIITTLRRCCPAVTHSIHAPTSVKKKATGSGKAEKALMINSLPASLLMQIEEAGYRKTTGQADIADAYWLSRMGTP